MSVTVNRLTNANVYVNGASFLGQAMEIDLPPLTQKVADHNALGMIGTLETVTGVDKMESTIRWTSPSREIYTTFGNPNQVVQMQIRGSLEQWGSTGRTGEIPYIVYMTAQSKTAPLGNFRQHENVELEHVLNVLSVKLEIDGAPIMEFDVLSNIYKVDGVDIAADYRSNLGI